MREGRKPAQVTYSVLRPENNLCGTSFTNNGVNNTDVKALRQFPPGNKCGFIRGTYRFPKFKSDNQRRPHSLEELKRRIKQSLADKYLFPEFLEMFYHLPRNGKYGRLRRADKLEATCSLMLYSLVHHVNLKTLQLGHFDNRNQFINYNFGIVKSETGMNDSRIERASELLQEMGLIEVKVIVNKHNKTERVLISVTEKLFNVFELEEAFLKDRQDVIKKFTDKQDRLDRNKAKLERYSPSSKPLRDIQQQLANLMQNKLINPASRINHGQVKLDAVKSYSPKSTLAQNKQVLDLAFQLRKENPQLSGQEAVEIAARKLYGH